MEPGIGNTRQAMRTVNHVCPLSRFPSVVHPSPTRYFGLFCFGAQLAYSIPVGSCVHHLRDMSEMHALLTDRVCPFTSHVENYLTTFD